MLSIAARSSPGPISSPDLQRGHRRGLHAIEARRQLQQRRITPRAHVGNDPGHALLDGRVRLGRPVLQRLQLRLEVGGVRVQPADVHLHAPTSTAFSKASIRARKGSCLSFSAAGLTTRRELMSMMCSTSNSWLALSVLPVLTRSTC